MTTEVFQEHFEDVGNDGPIVTLRGQERGYG
jgi:hypothetical protein